ncbi:SPASM domain-containing protein [Pseudomonas aeruginosa]|uniref:radical SAM protein n=1 Tax=Pseudomonas aeruginosa TaxID=287 RepID=UPI0024AD3BAB|nr:SPASM domain-containing protein [Pseudomonas aeruginosa]MDI6672045.1 SPASM domain-containing protein [Pseudomonas aeruginosa]
MLQVYLKPTNFCNVGCDFCYLPEDVRANKSRMSEATLQDSLVLIRNLAEREGHDRVSILYHGGEPLSMNAGILMDLSDKVRRGLTGIEIQEAIQTSLIPLRLSHIPFLQERCGGFVGSSIDFSGRTIQGSNSKYIDLWLEKVHLARSHSLHVGPIMVPTRNELGRVAEIYGWFKEHGFTHFNIERYNPYGADGDRPSNKEHSDFLSDLFDVSIEDLRRTGSCVTNNAVAAAIGGVLHNQPGERWGGTCQRDFLVINPDGALNTCPDRMEYETDLWPKVQDGIDAFQSSPERLGWIKVQHIDHIENHCRKCEFRSWCKSGCPITDHQVHTGAGECAGYRSHLAKVKEFVANEEGRRFATGYLSAAGALPFDPYTIGLERIA